MTRHVAVVSPIPTDWVKGATSKTNPSEIGDVTNAGLLLSPALKVECNV